MTIKQQGGIFGRNPTFNDVTVDGDLVVDGGITVPADSISGDAIDGGTPTTDGITLQSASSPIQLKDASDVRRWLIQKGADDLFFYRYNTSGGYAGNPLTINSTTGLSTFEGNIKMKTAGTGIDFSATAGTGTSELFDDYEEGTWTPVVGASSDEIGTWDTSFDATYVKVGRLVTCNMVINGTGMGFSTTTGSRQYTGLPFQPMDNGSGVYGTSSFGQGGGVTIFAGSSSIYLNRPYDTAGVSQIYATFSYQTNA